MTVYFSVLHIDESEWVKREIGVRAWEQERLERGHIDLAQVKKRRSFRRRAQGFSRSKARELLAEVES